MRTAEHDSEPKPSEVVLLNGPSSAGKSSIAHALKEQLERAGLRSDIVSIDDHMQIAKDEPIWEEDVFDAVPSMCQAILHSLEQGRIAIIDHVITSERIYRALLDALDRHTLKRVLVSCSPELLAEREAARGNRFVGSAEASLRYLFPQDGYDLNIDSGKLSPKDAAQAIFNSFFAIAADELRNVN